MRLPLWSPSHADLIDPRRKKVKKCGPRLRRREALLPRQSSSSSSSASRTIVAVRLSARSRSTRRSRFTSLRSRKAADRSRRSGWASRYSCRASAPFCSSRPAKASAEGRSSAVRRGIIKVDLSIPPARHTNGAGHPERRLRILSVGGRGPILPRRTPAVARLSSLHTGVTTGKRRRPARTAPRRSRASSGRGSPAGSCPGRSWRRPAR